jgi:hypothetical protein
MNELSILPSLVIAKEAANHVKRNQLDVSQGLKVPVVNKFFDVFFQELIVTLLDRDIKFVIEIVPKLLLYVRTPIGWLLSN